MLKTTVHDDPASVTLQLEGGLAGIWVQELERCWRQTTTARTARQIRFDLTDVTFIDATGKAFLAARHVQGAQLVASGCITRAIIAEIAGNGHDANRSRRDCFETKRERG
jgi:anti-anti-sigma regulatory factor